MLTLKTKMFKARAVLLLHCAIFQVCNEGAMHILVLLPVICIQKCSTQIIKDFLHSSGPILCLFMLEKIQSHSVVWMIRIEDQHGKFHLLQTLDNFCTNLSKIKVYYFTLFFLQSSVPQKPFTCCYHKEMAEKHKS